MSHSRRFLVGALGALGLLGLTAASVGADQGDNLVEFDSMTPVTGAAVGHLNDRGILGGGLPWVITEGQGQLDAQGNLEVEVQGLIIPLPVVNGHPGNPIPNFVAAVSCLGVTPVLTGPFPASATGNSEIEAHVALPSTCNSPEVFVGAINKAGTFVWFARANNASQDS